MCDSTQIGRHGDNHVLVCHQTQSAEYVRNVTKIISPKLLVVTRKFKNRSSRHRVFCNDSRDPKPLDGFMSYPLDHRVRYTFLKILTVSSIGENVAWRRRRVKSFARERYPERDIKNIARWHQLDYACRWKKVPVVTDLQHRAPTGYGYEPRRQRMKQCRKIQISTSYPY